MKRDAVVIGGHRGARGSSLARQRREPRSRWAVAATIGSVSVLVCLVCGGGWWLLTAPTFAVSQVESGPYRFSRQADVDMALRTALGANIWRLKSDDVSTAFDTLPWVRSVNLRRRIPDTVRVELTEWRPLLAVAPDPDHDPGLVLVGDGRVLEFPRHLPEPSLPLLMGCALQRGEDGATRLDPTLWPLVDQLVAALAATGLESVCPIDFVRATPRGLELVLQRHAGRLTLGREDLEARLQRYLLARSRIPHGATVDLRFADRVTFEPPAPDQS